MHQRERIAWYVMRGELLESEELNEAFRSLGGNRSLRGRAAKAEWLMMNVHPEKLAQYIDFQFVRICSHCGKAMCWGYCVNGGCEYYCSDECLNQHYTDEELQQMYNDGEGDSYYTSWID